MVLAGIAAVLDWRWRRIPNWLTVSGCGIGVVVQTVLSGWLGLKAALEGALLGLALLLPFVLLRSLGGGDWKLAGALGAFLGPRDLGAVLVTSILLAGVMALGMVIWTGRLKRTLVNIGRILGSLVSLHVPPADLSIDDPQSAKIPFGVAIGAAAVVMGVGRFLGKL